LYRAGGAGERRLRLRFDELEPAVEAAALRLDPINAPGALVDSGSPATSRRIRRCCASVLGSARKVAPTSPQPGREARHGPPAAWSIDVPSFNGVTNPVRHEGCFA
jgi:hypothetical protein